MLRKKLLSLGLAAAMVATTSVSAFATTHTFDETQSKDVDVTITGNVEDQQGQIKPGTISVTVPTATAFTVNKDGQFQGANLKIENTGNIDVQVSAMQFVDTTVGTGIVVGAESGLASVDRTNVAMNLTGNYGVAYLKSEAIGSGKTGIYSDEELTTAAASGIKISEINANASDTLELKGGAGSNKSNVDEAVSDRFTLTLRINKKGTK